MPRKMTRMPYILSILLAVFMTIQSAGGLLIERLYRDNAWVTSAWQGNDLVTLVAAVPILLAALILSRRGSIRAQMIWLGALYYGLYNDMYYLFGSAFNPFFLIYVTIAVLSTFALVSGLTGVDIDSIRRAISAKTPRRLVSGWMFLFAVTLGVLWIGQCFQYGMTGQVPQLITDTGGPTHLVAALDLWMIVPPVLLAGVWLWKRRPWGHLLSAAILVQGTLTTLGLIVAAPFQNAAGIAGAWDLVPLWSVIGAGCLTSSVLLLCSLVPIRFFRSRPGGP